MAPNNTQKIPFTFEIDIAEYVREHGESILNRQLSDEEVEDVIYNHVFAGDGIFTAVGDAVMDYDRTNQSIENHLTPPVHNFFQPLKSTQVMCPACKQTVSPKRLDLLQSLHKAICNYYKIEESTAIPIEVTIRVDGSVVDHLNPEAFDLIRKS